MLQIGLSDMRKASPTFGMRNTLYVGELRPWQMLIPPGVAHGYKVIGDEAAVLVYVTEPLLRSVGRIARSATTTAGSTTTGRRSSNEDVGHRWRRASSARPSSGTCSASGRTYTRRHARQADLRRQPREPGQPSPATRATASSTATSATRRWWPSIVARRRHRRGRPFRGRIARRSQHPVAGAGHRDQRARHAACSTRRAAGRSPRFLARLDRRGLRQTSPSRSKPTRRFR